MKKGLIASVLGMLMVLQIMLPAASVNGETADVADDWKYTEAVTLFNRIGLYESLDAEELRDAVVSRADFAVYAARVLRFDETAKSDVRYFADVPMEHWAQSSINYLVENGAVTVPDDQLFHPDEPISGNEAIKIMVCLTGFGQYAELTGGYPTGYLRVARQLDLTLPAQSEPLSFQSCTKLLLSAMKAELNYVVGVEGDTLIYQQQEDKTLFSIYWNIYECTGRINSVFGGSLVRGYNEDEGYILIDDRRFAVQDADYSELLGQTVDVFYEDGENGAIDTIIHICTDPNDNRIVEVSDEDFLSFSDDYTFSYYSSEGRRHSLSVDKGAYVLRNGELLDFGISAAFQIESGFYRLLDTDFDSQYDVVLLYDYTVFCVSSVDTSTNTIYSQQADEPLVLPEERKIIGEGDQTMDLADVQSGDILNVYQAEEFTTLYVSRKTIQGKIEELSNNQGMILKINGTEYRTCGSFEKLYGENLTLSAQYTFYLDWYGRIADVSINTDEKIQFGYLIKAAMPSGIDPKLMLRIFTQDGEMLAVNCAYKVKVDGISHETGSLETTLRNANDGRLAQLIRFSLNSDGDINFIDTKQKTDSEPDFSLTHTFTGTEIMYTAGLVNRFGGYGLVKKTALGFMIPPTDQIETATDDMFSIMPESYLSTSVRAPKVDLYSVDPEEPFAAVAVIEETGSVIQDNTQFAVVSYIAKELQDDGEVMDALWVFDGQESRYLVDDSLSLEDMGIGEGDVVRLGMNANGYVNQIDIMLHYTRGEKIPTSSILWTGYTFAENRITFGHVIYKKDRTIQWGYQGFDAVDEAVELAESLPIIVYDDSRRENKIYLGTINDILDYKTAGGQASTILAHERFGEPKRLLVYKNGLR